MKKRKNRNGDWGLVDKKDVAAIGPADSSRSNGTG